MILAGELCMAPVIFTLATKARKAGLASTTAAPPELVAETPGASVAAAVVAGWFAIAVPVAVAAPPEFPAAGFSGTS